MFVLRRRSAELSYFESAVRDREVDRIFGANFAAEQPVRIITPLVEGLVII
jgi:hypothetical protein